MQSPGAFPKIWESLQLVFYSGFPSKTTQKRSNLRSPFLSEGEIDCERCSSGGLGMRGAGSMRTDASRAVAKTHGSRRGVLAAVFSLGRNPFERRSSGFFFNWGPPPLCEPGKNETIRQGKVAPSLKTKTRSGGSIGCLRFQGPRSYSECFL